MATNNQIAANNAGQAQATQVGNAQAKKSAPHGIDYCLQYKGAYAGNMDDVIESVGKTFMHNVKAHTQYAGRHIDLLADWKRKDAFVYNILNSVEFRVYHRYANACTVWDVVEDGKVVGTHVVLCAVKRITDKTDTSKIVTVDAEAVSKFRGIKLTKGQSLVCRGYRFAAGEDFTTCTEMPKTVEHLYERTVMQNAKADDGTSVEVPVKEAKTDESGNTTYVDKKEVVMGEYYFVLDETISPKVFRNTFATAFKYVWTRYIFASNDDASVEQAENAEVTNTAA